MLSEYSDDLASLYEEGVEVDFFRNKEEMIRKIRLYLADEKLRGSVAQAGFQKVRAAGHDIDSRMKLVVDWVAKINEPNKAYEL